MSQAIFEMEGLIKRYAERVILQIDALAISAQRTTALLGPSGTGKSTLLRLLNFLESPDEGILRFAGQVVPPSGPDLAAQRLVTTVFQRPLLLDTSVWENVAYGLRVRGTYTPAAVAHALEQVGMAHLAKSAGRTLSGGEAQRVALARALVFTPQVLLLDEPTASLDRANVAAIEAIIGELRRTGTTIVVVTHNLFQARRLADEAILLIDGRLVEHGPIAQIFDAPRDQRTAEFCSGTMVY